MKKLIDIMPKFVWLFIVFVIVAIMATAFLDHEKEDVMWPYMEEAFKTVAIVLGQPYAYTTLFSVWEAMIYIAGSYANRWSEDELDRWVAEKYGHKIILARIFCIGMHFIFLFVQLWTISIIRHQADLKLRGKRKKIAYVLAYPAATLFGGAVHLMYNSALTSYVAQFFIRYIN